MKHTKNIILIGLLISSINLLAQSKEVCSRCNMTIKDNLHQSTAIRNGKLLEFDAIECLVNFIKETKPGSLNQLKVADYSNGEYISAEKAFYLKCKAIPSPMGAFLSGFKEEEEAKRLKAKKGGEIYTWTELLELFEDSEFGSLDHIHHNHYRSDAHAPIGVMGDHLHHKGGLMVSVRYMNMNMKGNMTGTSIVDDETIYKSYMIAPQEMQMQMYMLGMMYAPSDRITLMFMQNYLQNKMDLTAQMRMGGMMMNGQMMGGMLMQRDFSTSSEGFGDMRVGALFGLLDKENKTVHLNTQINLPTGSLDERDATPMNNDIKLPYRMQLGTGTYDYSLGATYKQSFTTVSLGSQIIGTVRTGKNTEGYRFGNQIQINIWGAYRVNSMLSLSGRILGVTEGKIVGKDQELNPKMITTANTSNYGGEVLKSYLGFNVAFLEGSLLHRFRLGTELGTPFYENYLGIQMNDGMTVNVGIKYNIL